MLLKLIYRGLAFDGRTTPLRHELAAAKMAARIWQGRSPETLFTTLSRYAGPPLEYVHASLFAGGRKGADNEAQPRHEAVAEPRQSLTRGIAAHILKQSMPSPARQLLDDAMRNGEERRSYGREPYVHPAVLELSQNDERHCAFIRDVSVGGLGLLHFVNIKPQRITVETRRFNDQVISLELDIVWCVPCGEGCYMSGGTFVTPWTN